MNDVLPECGGFLLVQIDDFGYIKDLETTWTVHRETRRMDEWASYQPSFQEAKFEFGIRPQKRIKGILELTPDGGGYSLWVMRDDEEEALRRLVRWRGCYGSWPVHTLT